MMSLVVCIYFISSLQCHSGMQSTASSMSGAEGWQLYILWSQKRVLRVTVLEGQYPPGIIFSTHFKIESEPPNSCLQVTYTASRKSVLHSRFANFYSDWATFCIYTVKKQWIFQFLPGDMATILDASNNLRESFFLPKYFLTLLLEFGLCFMRFIHL